jgi:hypothetical protein
VCRRPDGREDEVVGVEPNHKTARKSGPLYIVQYSLGRIPFKTNLAGVGGGVVTNGAVSAKTMLKRYCDEKFEG